MMHDARHTDVPSTPPWLINLSDTVARVRTKQEDQDKRLAETLDQIKTLTERVDRGSIRTTKLTFGFQEVSHQVGFLMSLSTRIEKLEKLQTSITYMLSGILIAIGAIGWVGGSALRQGLASALGFK